MYGNDDNDDDDANHDEDEDDNNDDNNDEQQTCHVAMNLTIQIITQDDPVKQQQESVFI